MKQKGFSKLALIILLLFILGIGSYAALRNKIITSNPENLSSQENIMKTFHDDKLNLSFKYLPIYQIKKIDTNANTSTYIFSTGTKVNGVEDYDSFNINKGTFETKGMTFVQYLSQGGEAMGYKYTPKVTKMSPLGNSEETYLVEGVPLSSPHLAFKYKNKVYTASSLQEYNTADGKKMIDYKQILSTVEFK